jgi:hypothetical protein
VAPHFPLQLDHIDLLRMVPSPRTRKGLPSRISRRQRRGMFVNMLSEEESQKINGLCIILEAEAMKLCRMRLTSECES